jgi:hypothetical protein
MAGDSAARTAAAGARTRLRSVLDRAAAPGDGASRPCGAVSPARRVAGSTVLTWHKNLLTELDGNTPFTPDGPED